MTNVLAAIGRLKIVPVIALENAADARPLAEALVEGNLPIAEVTFRTAAAAEAIRTIAAHGGLLVGAGTVSNVDTVKMAIDCGATFIVSPGFNSKVVRYCVEQQIPITPGISSATDIESALDHGLSTVKFFPAEAIGGLKLLRALSAPYSQMRFMPTGGITLQNVGDYLRFAKVIACGGSWMVTKELLAARDFRTISNLCREAVAAAAAATA